MSVDQAESRGRRRPEGNTLPWTRRRGPESAAGLRSAAFTLIEMLVAIALLLVLMALAGQAFKVALDGTGRLTQLSQVDRSARMLRDQLAHELASINPSQSILAIQGNPSPAYWTEIQKQADDDGNMLNGLGSQRFSIDPLRENPTLGYDPLDDDDDRSFDGELDLEENFYPQLPRADILLIVTNLPDERSKVYADIRSDGPVMVVYNHAELGLLNGGSRVKVGDNDGVPCLPGDDFAGCDNSSTDDWAELRPIPILQDGGGMDPRLGVQEVAQFWHLARRAILLKRNFDPREDPAAVDGFDRYAHVLSPTDPMGNQSACVGFLEQQMPAVCGGLIDATWERHYLNWILGGEMDVVAPVGGSISVQLLAAGGGNLQDFVFAYEVPQRYFGGLGTLDRLVEDINDDGQLDPGVVSGTVSTRRQDMAVGLFRRGAVPAFWLARSHLDPEPPATLRHRLAHYFLPNCASFKVEWTPNDIRLEQAGLPEVVWIDPFKEPGNPNRAGYVPPANTNAPIDSITLNSVSKPAHLDEFEMMAQKMAPESSVPLAGNAVLGLNGNFDPDPANPPAIGSPLHHVQNELAWGFDGLGGRFGLSVPGAVRPTQANVFDADVRALPASAGVQPSYNTHSWYARDLAINNAGQPRTLTAPDPLWPKALRITVDLFDDSGKLEKPVRHVFVLPIGSKDDRKQTLG